VAADIPVEMVRRPNTCLLALITTLVLAAPGCSRDPSPPESVPAANPAVAPERGAEGKPTPLDPPTQANAIADAYIQAYFRAFPEQATFYRIEGARHDALTDNTPAGRRSWQAIEDDLLRQLERIDPARLEGTSAWLTYGVLRAHLEASRATRICRDEEWDVDQVWGWQIALGELADAQPMDTVENRARAVTRWRQVARYIDNEIADLKTGLADGYSSPRHNVDLVIAQLDGLLAMAPEDTPFYGPARNVEDEAFRAAWQAIIAESINPAIQRYRDYLETGYRPDARQTISITAHPDGVDCYRALLQAYTTLPYAPEEMFEAGKEAVALREKRIGEIGDEIYASFDLAEIRRRLREEAGFGFDSRQAIVDYTTLAVQRARDAMSDWVGKMPAADVVIKPIPEYQEQSSTARYVAASDDGALPGTYFINLFQPDKQNRGEVESVAFHETYPGHHLQIALAQEQAEAHPVLRYLGNSGFIEGWARYSETLADEMGLYSSRLNTLSMLSGLPTGMVVDPGIHTMGWSRDEAIDYALSKQVNMTPEEAASYVDRIVVWPGQMVTYGAGELEIIRLRRQAENALGEDFDIKTFHDRVLGNGSVTLGMLRENIEQWLTER